jgi:phage-related minor tail protein
MERDGDGGAAALESQIAALEDSFVAASAVASAFDGELQRMRGSLAETNVSVGAVSSSVSRGLRRAFDGLAFDGMKLSDALQTVGQSIIDATYSAAMKPITAKLGGLVAQGLSAIGAVGFAKGGAFTQGRVMPFAKGGVVTSAHTFPMRGGTGLMGEAGPEAILPLARGADGSLGVRADGGAARPVQVVMHITTPDVGGFQRSQGQIAARMGRVLARGERNR